MNRLSRIENKSPLESNLCTFARHALKQLDYTWRTADNSVPTRGICLA